MNKVFGILILLFLGSCASTTEPISQTNNPAKVSDEVKIIYSSSDEIYIMANMGLVTGPLNKKPKKSFIKTALNHCTQFKKNSYYLYHIKDPIPYSWSKMFDSEYSQTYTASKHDLYDWREFIYNNERYSGYRFVSANSTAEALEKPLTRELRFISSFGNLRTYHRGTHTAVEQKRFVSSKEVAENAKKAKEKKIKEAKLQEEKRKNFMASLDKLYGNECMGGAFKKKLKKGTIEFDNCLLDKDNDAKLKAQTERELLEKKNAELEKKQAALNKKLAAMKPKERHAYNCSETFKFRKGTEKFNDCVFKLYTAELDLQKLELEKQVAEAKIEAAANEQARAEAVANAQIASAKASERSARLRNSIDLMKMGSSMMSGSSSKSSSNNSSNDRLRTTCRNVGGFLVCN